MKRLRFSLRTLLLFVLLLAGAVALWWRQGPWVLERKFNTSGVSLDLQRFVEIDSNNRGIIRNTLTGEALARFGQPGADRFQFYSFSPNRECVIGLNTFTRKDPQTRSYWDATTGHPQKVLESLHRVLANNRWIHVPKAPLRSMDRNHRTPGVLVHAPAYHRVLLEHSPRPLNPDK